MPVHTRNPSAQETEMRRSHGRGQPKPSRETLSQKQNKTKISSETAVSVVLRMGLRPALLAWALTRMVPSEPGVWQAKPERVSFSFTAHLSVIPEKPRYCLDQIPY